MLPHAAISPDDLDLFHLVDTPEEASEVIRCYVEQCRQFQGDQRRNPV
jgi:predicted Rossmann-fold nucleotide-binding protein